LRIGVNTISAVTGGGVTYFANLLPELARLLEARGDTLVVYTRRNGRVRVPTAPALREACVAPEGLAGLRRGAWEQLWLPVHARRDKLDLFYGPADTLPLAMPCRTVCAFRNPNIYAPLSEEPRSQWARLLTLRGLAVAAGATCSRAIFVSAAARDEIAPAIRLPAAKARVVHHALGRVFRDALTGPRPWERPYLLSVSTMYTYKNFVRLVQAYDLYVKRSGLPHGLVIIGEPVEADYTARVVAEIAARGLRDDVRYLGEVKYPAVGPWYRHAAAFAFPSYRETFGHPLLEAMAADLPLAAADTAVMREIGGDVPLYFDPMSVDALGKALVEVLTGADRDAMVERGRHRVSEFTWRRTAEETLRVFDEARA
jgi:glycosyltransferase involved in cell wall biosynthesis